jgi:hypothetical protein
MNGRRIAGCSAVVCLLFVFAASSAPGEEKKDAPPLKKAACNWLVLNYKSYEHVITVDVNGKRFITFDREASGFESKPSPFKDGKNTLLITFALREERKARMGSRLMTLLSPGMMPGADPLPGLTVETSEPYGECQAEITLKDKVPGLLVYTMREWADKDRKHLLLEEKVESDTFKWPFEKTWFKSWTGEGKPFLEEYMEGGKLQTGKYYKPGGILGGEVNGGKGMKKEFYKDGAIALERPYAGGLANGLEKSYYGNGKPEKVVTWKDDVPDGECLLHDDKGAVVIRGTFKAGKKHGTWVRCAENGKESARTGFDNGKVVKGADRFAEFDQYQD